MSDGVLRIGLVGLGQRGFDALRTLAMLPGVEIAAVCDAFPERLQKAKDLLDERGRPEPCAFGGGEGWKGLCDCAVDLVYNATPWALHVPVALRAMACGHHVAVEVPAALTLEECWALVEASERTGRHCIQLENCCYGEVELMTLQMVRAGLFGELKHAECAYLHDLREWCYQAPLPAETDYGKTGYWDHWRLRWNLAHCGNQYPTHGLGPVCRCFDINRSDRLAYLVSLESRPVGFQDWAEAKMPGSELAAWRPQMGDVNTTLIRTAQGRSIMVQHDVTGPRPYSRINLLCGTRGIVQDYPLRMAFASEPGAAAHKWFASARAKRWAAKYRHPLWAEQGEKAKAVGGHGGMDFLMISRLCEALRTGARPDMDVYDLATTCAVCELSERSVRARSASVDFPDFTRGRVLPPAPSTF